MRSALSLMLVLATCVTPTAETTASYFDTGASCWREADIHLRGETAKKWLDELRDEPLPEGWRVMGVAGCLRPDQVSGRYGEGLAGQQLSGVIYQARPASETPSWGCDEEAPVCRDGRQTILMPDVQGP